MDFSLFRESRQQEDVQAAVADCNVHRTVCDVKLVKRLLFEGRRAGPLFWFGFGGCETAPAS